MKNIMKSLAEKEEKPKLCNEKFAIKNINLLICGSYFITIVMGLTLTAYIHYIEHQSQKIQIKFQNYLENELLKLKEYNNNGNNAERHG